MESAIARLIASSVDSCGGLDRPSEGNDVRVRLTAGFDSAGSKGVIRNLAESGINPSEEARSSLLGTLVSGNDQSPDFGRSFCCSGDVDGGERVPVFISLRTL